MGQRSEYERRRREFRERRPTHRCTSCTSVLYEDDRACLECGEQRPAGGWAKLGRTSDPWLGRAIVERYLLTRRIGQGASGAVYRAESLSIARQFAVKIIPLDNQDGSIKAEHIEARLNREVAALGHLRNPHIVSVYDVVMVSERAVAVLMDLIDGQTLETIVSEQGPLPIERACRILRQIANGVHEAHQAGMIHRDLKPENVMVERLPAGGDFVHILDFGIVRREGDVRVTQGFLGTPLYASPEQAVGGELDRRVDIYALGGVFFFMLTGRPPFYDPNVYNVLKAHVSRKPPRLEDLVARGQFPEQLESLVARMLAKSPTNRPQTLGEVIEALDAIADVLTDMERTPSSPEVHESAEMAHEHSGETGLGAGGLRTVDSDASLEEASREQLRVREQAKRASGFFRADDWDATGPKAAIFRGRTPTGEVKAPGSADDDVFERRRESGLYEIPKLVTSDTSQHLWCMCGVDDQILAVDTSFRARIGRAGQGYHLDFELVVDAEPATVCLGPSAAYSGDVDGTLRQWVIAEDTVDERVVHQNASASPIAAIGVDDDGKWLLFGTEAGGLYMGSVHNAELPEPLRIQSGAPVRGVALSSRRNLFAVARGDGGVSVFNFSAPGKVVHRFEAPGPVETMAFSRDGYLLAVVFADKKLALYQTMTGTQVMRNDNLLEQPLAIRFDARDQLQGYCEVNGRIFGWDLHHNLVPHQA
jgi:eukaryotic-like serine/threonine-protein kinase